MKLIVYGDFNCPYSALASYRVDELLRQGIADVEWRAVEHKPEMTESGEPVEGDLRKELEEEVGEIMGFRRPGEEFSLAIPDVRPNTHEAAVAYSTCEGEDAHYWRRRAFEAVWKEGKNISDQKLLGELATPGQAESRADEWQREWEGIERRVVPLMVLPDGQISRGKGALKRLGEMLDRGRQDQTKAS